MPKGERFVSSATICFPSLGAVGWRHRSVSIGPGRPLVKCLLSIDEVLPVFRWNCMNPPNPPFDLRNNIMLYRIFFLNSFDFMCMVDGLIVYLNGSSVFILSMMIPSTFAHVSGLFSRMAIGDQLPRCDAHRSPLRGWVGDDPVRGDLNPHNWRKTRID